RENSSGKILIATSRFSFVSRARYTSPMPPLPRRAVISWEPSCAPMVKGMVSHGIIEQRGQWTINRVTGNLNRIRKARLSHKTHAKLASRLAVSQKQKVLGV